MEGWGCWHTLKHLHCASGCSIAQKDQKISLIRPTLRETLSESFHLFWHPEDSLKEPYVSSALSQQQYRAFLPYHANEVEIQTYCPAGKIRELTGCLVLAYCLGHRNKPGVQFTTYSLLLYSSFSGVHLFRMDYNPLLLLLLNPYQICQWSI